MRLFGITYRYAPLSNQPTCDVLHVVSPRASACTSASISFPSHPHAHSNHRRRHSNHYLRFLILLKEADAPITQRSTISFTDRCARRHLLPATSTFFFSFPVPHPTFSPFRVFSCFSLSVCRYYERMHFRKTYFVFLSYFTFTPCPP